MSKTLNRPVGPLRSPVQNIFPKMIDRAANPGLEYANQPYKMPSLAEIFGSASARKIEKIASKKGFRLLLLKDNPPSDQTAGWDPYAAGRLMIESLKQAEGGAISRDEVAQKLGISRASVYNWIDALKLVVWTDPASRYQFPRWQFGANGVLTGVEECLKILSTDDHWAVMRFFLVPSEAAGDVSPLNLLRAGQIEVAKEIASGATARGQR